MSSVEQFTALWKDKITEEEFCAMLEEGRPVSQTWIWATAKQGNLASQGAREISMHWSPLGRARDS
jgi:hypothetical protein